MIKNKKITAVILAAGNSVRYGQNKNKNLELINKKTVLSYSLKAFNENKYVDDIIVAVRDEDKKSIMKIIAKEKNLKNIEIIIGGKTRKESVYNSLNNTDCDIVIIHDAARPAIKQEYINKCIESMDKFKGCTIGVKTKDTVKITDENNIVKKSTNRSNTWMIQTPQCFDKKILLKLHQKYKEDVTDDCMLLEKDNYDIKVIEGDYTNIKITTYEDLSIVKILLNKIN